jgi:hypothetical protein
VCARREARAQVLILGALRLFRFTSRNSSAAGPVSGARSSSDASVHRDDRETLAVVDQQASAMVRRSAGM